MVPDNDGAYYHREHGVCLVDVEWNLVWDITGGYPHDLDKSAPTDWLGPVPTAEEWARAQARMARMEVAIREAAVWFEDEADDWASGANEKASPDDMERVMDRYAADLRKALEP
jgi:hypothetical protein